MFAVAARRLRAQLGAWCGAQARARSQLDGTRAAVLMYHRVLPLELALERSVEPGMVVTPETFSRQLDWLQQGFAVLPLAELVGRLAVGRPLPPRACALSFDDGWRDNHEYALPELARRGLPATVFLVSRRVGTQGAFWPDQVSRWLARLGPEPMRSALAALGAPEHGEPRQAAIAHLKALPETERAEALTRLRERVGDAAAGEDERELLDWPEIERMAAAGIDFESHAASHALLPALSRDEAARELAESLHALRERGHARHALLAYPNGSHDPCVRSLARAAGYRAAFTTERGLVAFNADPFALPRLGLHEDISASRAEFHRVIPGSGLAR
jgi:peptidoglycan/xylan/chitin deacetylase (PgdA/CDA1 family)